LSILSCLPFAKFQGIAGQRRGSRGLCSGEGGTFPDDQFGGK
jgi:hypothetical protein